MPDGNAQWQVAAARGVDDVVRWAYLFLKW